MQIREFRRKEFVNREKEVEFLKNWVDKIPDEILWLYGPKSAGKTTLVEYVIEKELTSNLKIFDRYWIKFISFRRTMVGNYDSFINSFFEESEVGDDLTDEINAGFTLGVIRLEAKILEKIRNKKKNLFNELIEKFKKIKKTKILVIDEIQTLEDIYFNGEKELLKEFLNFCVSLTKETHLCHVIILSSNTIFIDNIYNDAKLKVTSEFNKVDHLTKEDVFEYLEYKTENTTLVTKQDFELIWDYLGGCIPLIQRLFGKIQYYSSLKEYLDYEVKLAKSEIVELMKRFMDDEKKTIFKEIAKEIVRNGCYESNEYEKKEYLDVIDFMSGKEIFFYDPIEQVIKGSNSLYEQAFERLL